MRGLLGKMATIAPCACVLLSCDLSTQQSRADDAMQEINREISHREDAREKQERVARAASDSRMHALFDEQTKKPKKPEPEIVLKPSPAVVPDPVGDWLKAAPSECAFKFNQSACFLAPDDATPEQKHECTDGCTAAIKTAAGHKIESAFDECASAAEAPPTCTIEFPAGADPAGTGEAPFREGVAKMQVECAKACTKQRATNVIEAKEREKAAQQGNGLVLVYKRCMLATDGTLLAIRYRVHDTGLYQDLMEKTDARCRSGSRCDWLEGHSDEFQCSYGN